MVKKQKSHYSTKSSAYLLLKEKWLRRHKRTRKLIHKKHKEAFEWLGQTFPDREKLAGGAIGLLMLSSALPASTAIAQYTNTLLKPKETEAAVVDKTQVLLSDLQTVVPEQMRPLTADEEAKFDEILSRNFSMQVKHEIDGKRLNRTYGVIGAEQHLMRYPGDTMASHLSPEEARDKFIYSSGMAPGRGAWGYFAKSKAEMTDQVIERERWYIAVQTFAAPNYGASYKGFFQFRKMLVVNSKTGQAIVTVIGDSGPAIWTGKHLGGSPEVMHHLGFSGGMRKGPVLYFFIDDPNDTIPLGPVNL